MLPPYELQNKPFRTALKGYNATEVDEHLEFVMNKYTELYRAYNDLERRLAASEAELERYRKNEDAIRRALVNAQNAGTRIMKEAGERSQLILQSTKDNCKKILIDFDAEIQQKQDTLQALKTQVYEFKSRMFSLYQKHIEFLEAISPEGEDSSEWQLAPEEYVSNVIGQVVLDVDAAEENSLLPGITDPPKIKIDDETLESLMASGKNEDPDADVKIAKPRRSESPSLTFADTQAVNLSDIRREKDAKDKERVLSVDADTEHTVIFKRPQG
ncbi:MAG: DivIVA domain-containing protein [Clostridia bacterium]|nr:DivIVA domain-containing protein [Clostridia bacterium]